MAPGVTCGSVGEGGNLTLSCPAGQTITGVDFASYGTPNGACGAYTTSACHSSTSVSVVATSCLNLNSCTIGANNGVFGDPCGGTVKRLTAQVRCAPKTDCLDILVSGLSVGDGLYTIDTDGFGAGTSFQTYCDMTNGGWTLINDQDVNYPSSQTGYLPTATWAAGVSTTAPNGGQWGVLNRMASFQRTDGQFELKLTYGTTATQYVSWTQSANPFSGSRGTVVVTGMNPANQSGCGAFAGMGNDSTAFSALDGDVGGCWWFAVGSNQGYPSAASLPASNSPSILPSRIKLWSRKATTSGLQHCWAGESNGADSVTSNTANVGTDVTYSVGRSGQAFTCSTVSGTPTTNVRATTAPTVSAIGPWTYEFWINRVTSSPIAWVLDRTIPGNPLVNLNADSTGSSYFFIRYNSGASVASPPFVLTGGYHHLAAVRGAGSFRFYRDGVLIGTVADSGGVLRPDPPRWCGHVTFPDSAMTGQFDSLRIWSRALSGAEVTSVANGNGSCSALPLP